MALVRLFVDSEERMKSQKTKLLAAFTIALISLAGPLNDAQASEWPFEVVEGAQHVQWIEGRSYGWSKKDQTSLLASVRYDKQHKRYVATMKPTFGNAKLLLHLSPCVCFVP